MISITNATYTYPGADYQALAGASLQITDGEFTLVCGESGSGKSTLMRLPNGIVPSHTGGTLTGSVSTFGLNPAHTPTHDFASVVGFVNQDPDSASVAETVFAEVAFAPSNLGVTSARLRKRVEETIDALGIGNLRGRRLDTLSGGERQRVAIAAVLSALPSAILLDEPTSSLDPQSADDVFHVLLRLRDDLGLTIVCAEHRLERVAGMTDSVALVTDGKVQQGNPREIFNGLASAPPVTRLGAELGWDPLPLTVREARARMRTVTLPDPKPASRRDGSGLAVEIKKLSTEHTIDDLTVTFPAGCVTAVVGRNGSGKTTLLRTIAGLQRPVRGRVVVCGERVEGPRGDIAYLPQRASALLYRETVGAELEAGSVDPALARRLGIDGYRHRHPFDLSAGQRLRVAIALTVSRECPVLLLDEPTRGLDHTGKQVLTSLLGECADAGRCVIVVTHDVELVAEMADRVVMLAEGEIAAEGRVQDVLGESLLFSTQISKATSDPGRLTLEDTR